MKKQRFLVTGEHYTHLDLWRTARVFLKQGSEDEKGSFYPLLATGVFAFFAFEALMNEMLRLVDPEAWKNERERFATGEFRGTLGKFDYLANLCGLGVDRGTRPYQTVKDLAKARDTLVHARTERYEYEVRASNIDEIGPIPTLLDRYSSHDYAERATTDVEALGTLLLGSLRRKFGDIGVGGSITAFDGVYGGRQISFLPPVDRAGDV